MGALQPGLTVFEVDVGFGNLCAALTQSLDFPTIEHDAGFKPVLDVVVVPGASIDGDLPFTKF